MIPPAIDFLGDAAIWIGTDGAVACDTTGGKHGERKNGDDELHPAQITSPRRRWKELISQALSEARDGIFSQSCQEGESSASHPAIRSAIISVGRWMLLDGMVGMMLASAT
jgi:hypothetical protein